VQTKTLRVTLEITSRDNKGKGTDRATTKNGTVRRRRLYIPYDFRKNTWHPSGEQ